MSEKNEYLTITLTGRPPVTIRKGEWPFLASADDKIWDNQYEFQANRTSRWDLNVRRHADGRMIVYAIHRHESQYQSEQGADIRGGELLAADGDVVASIQRVGAEMESRMPKGSWNQGVFPRLVHECIAALPAVEI